MGAKTYESRLIAEINKVMTDKRINTSFQDKCELCVEIIYKMKMAYGQGVNQNDIPKIMSMAPKIPYDKINAKLNSWKTMPVTISEAQEDFRDIMTEALIEEIENNPAIKRAITDLVKKKLVKLDKEGLLQLKE